TTPAETPVRLRRFFTAARGAAYDLHWFRSFSPILFERGRTLVEAPARLHPAHFHGSASSGSNSLHQQRSSAGMVTPRCARSAANVRAKSPATASSTGSAYAAHRSPGWSMLMTASSPSLAAITTRSGTYRKHSGRAPKPTSALRMLPVKYV